MNQLFIQGVQILWDRISDYSYLRRIPALQFEESLMFSKPITFFVGENGTGKSTLLEGIAVAYGFNPEGGSKNYNFSTYDSHSELHRGLRLMKGIQKPGWSYFLRAESFYNVATKEEDYADQDHPSKKYHEKSHGESFLALAQGSFRPHGLYLLDEPEAALSPQRQLTLLIEISRQTAVLAFVYGDGFSNVFYPTNPVVLISLGMIGLSYGKWAKWTAIFQMAIIAVTSGLLLLATAVGY